MDNNHLDHIFREDIPTPHLAAHADGGSDNITHKHIDAAKSKLAPTAEELYPNMKFVENKFVSQLEVNKQLMEFAANQKRSWANDEDFIKGLYDKIIVSDIYKEYMASSDKSYEVDRELWRKLYKAFVFNNEELDVLLEDQSLYWNDDKEIVDTFVLKRLNVLRQKMVLTGLFCCH